MLEFFHAKKLLVLEEVRTLNLTKFDGKSESIITWTLVSKHGYRQWP
jgi:hypothetical protein